MSTTNATNFRKNIFEYLDQTIKYNMPLTITTKAGNAVLLSEDDYLGLLETLYLLSKPTVKDVLIEGKHTPLSECISEDEVIW